MPHGAKHRAMLWLDDAAFRPCAAPPPLADDEVHLWLIRSDGTRGRDGESVANGRLRRLLAGYLGRSEAEVVMQRSAHGKPFLALAGAPQFNLSHSGAHVAVALARPVAPGVDVELPQRPRPVLALARRYFHPDEATALAALPAERVDAAFHALWTCKEAVLKAHGRGLAFGLHRLGFALDPRAGLPTALCYLDAEAGPPATWQVLRFAPAADAFGALAWRGPALPVRGFRAVD